MTEQDLLEQKRAERAKRKKIFMLRRITALAVLFLVVMLVVFGVTRIVAAISSARNATEVTEQIGPTLPLSTDSVSPLLTPYDYSAPVPFSASADGSSFSKSLLIGDSRVGVYSIYGGLLPAGMVFAYNENVSVTSALTADFTLSSGDEADLGEIIVKGGYDRIYLEFGLNELGWQYSSAFSEGYAALLSEIRRLAPSADIYTQSIIPVSASLGSDYITNQKISQYNQLILSSAKNVSAYYIDLGETFSSALGETYDAGNGIGLTRAGAEAWVSCLKTHLVNKENYS